MLSGLSLGGNSSSNGLNVYGAYKNSGAASQGMSFAQFINEQMQDNGSGVGTGLPNGSMFYDGTIGNLGSPHTAIFGNDGLPTFNPSSIKSNPVLSGLFENGAFNNAIDANVLRNIARYADVNNDDGQRIGTINQDLIKDAIKGLPLPTISGERPPVQQGPTQTPPDDSGSVGDQVNGPIVGGDGQVPEAPSSGGNNNRNPILDILRNLPLGNGGGGVSQTPTGADNESDFDLTTLLGSIFGSGGAADNTNQNSNIISDLIGAVTGGNSELSNILGDIGNTVINAGATDYAADKQLEANRDALDFNRYIYDSGIDRLEPFRQSGLNSLGALQSAANSNPQFRSLFEGVSNAQAGNRSINSLDPSVNYDAPSVTSTQGLPALQAGSRGVTLGDSSQVGVNEFNPYDANDPRLQHLIDTGTRAVEDSLAARGKLNSGQALEALQEVGQNAALGRANEIQALESDRDRLSLASQGQSFGQTTTNAGLSNQLNQQDLSNSSGIRSQLFGEGTTQFGQGLGLAGLDIGAQGQEFSQGYQANQFNNLLNQQDFSNSAYQGDTNFARNLSVNQFGLGADQNQFSKLYDMTRLGQNSAANQAAGGASFSNIGTNILQNQGDIRTARTAGFTNALSGLF